MKSRNERICDALADYYEVVDRIAVLKSSARELKERVLALARNGRYGRYTVGAIEKKIIHVKAYERSSYRYVRRGKEIA